jgi:hypothetical protein
MSKHAARWDDDARGEGVADGSMFVPPLDRLREAMLRSNWIAEDPDAHLLPHLERWCEGDDSPLDLGQASPNGHGVFEVSLVPRGAMTSAQMRAAVFALLGSIVEGATFVHQVDFEGRTIWEATTGMLDDQTPFRSHGHTLRFVIAHPEAL